jgi:iron complex outermembrane receptor protein
MHRSRFRSAALLWLAATPAVPAQQPPITISAGRTEAWTVETPASISVVDRVEIERQAVSNPADLLRARGAVQVSDYYGDGSALVDMRGFGPTAGSNTLILVDGRRLNNAGDIAPPDLGSIDLGEVERVEILQGSAGTLFGNQAVGGVVNFITRRPGPFNARALAASGSYDAYSLEARASERLASGLGFRVSGRKQESNNYRDNNASDRDQVALRLEFGEDEELLFWEQAFQRHEQQLPGSLFREELAADRRQSATAYRGDFSDTETWLGRLGLRHPLSDAWSLEAELSYRDNDRRFQTSFRAFPGSPATQTRRVWDFNPRLVGLLPLGATDLKLTLGADLERTDYTLRTAFGPQDQEQRQQAVYGQLAAPLGRGWSAIAGLRHATAHDRIDNLGQPVDLNDRVTVGSAGLVYRPAAGWRLFARWDQNFRFPGVDEHTNVVTGQPAGLEPQTGDSYELGVELSRSGLQSKAQVYRLALDNEISFDSSTFFNINLASTRRTGGILELSWLAAPHWRLGGSYAYTDNRVTAGPFTGQHIPLVAEHQGRVFLDWGSGAGFGLAVEALAIGERVLGGDFANDFARLDPYAVINLTTRYHASTWEVTARINNLLNESYSETGAVGYDRDFALRDAYFPSPERNLWITLSCRFAD